MKVKVAVSELEGASLDWAVAKCIAEVHEDDALNGVTMCGHWISGLFAYPNHWVRNDEFKPSTSWSTAGPIIEQNCITVVCAEGDYSPELRGHEVYWVAEIGKQCPDGPQGDDWGLYYRIDGYSVTGSTPLVAAMRCLVQYKLGNEIEIPKDLT